MSAEGKSQGGEFSRKGDLLGYASVAPHPAYISSFKFDYLSTNLNEALRNLEGVLW